MHSEAVPGMSNRAAIHAHMNPRWITFVTYAAISLIARMRLSAGTCHLIIIAGAHGIGRVG